MNSKNNCKFIFVTGGVTSSLGKGLTSASIGHLLENAGFTVKIRKMDPYLNIDPGTMSPNQHGEVFVTKDGLETDLDLGHYERFTSIETTKDDSISSGRVYCELLNNEKFGKYLGNTVQVIPHVTEIIKKFITKDSADVDFLICEIGGTVGDIEALPLFESIRQIKYACNNRVFFIHVALLPYLSKAQELKTKPTQHSVKSLLTLGIQPNMIICRSEVEIQNSHKEKIANFCNIPKDNVIPGYDVDNIYTIPLNYKNLNVDKIIIDYFNLKASYNKNSKYQQWQILFEQQNPEIKINFYIVGKYKDSSDIYLSLKESISHSCFGEFITPNIVMIDSNDVNSKTVEGIFADADCIIVPGGFGSRGIDGKICAIKYAREHNIPFLGICLGMQLAIIEFARNKCLIEGANSTEFDPMTSDPIISRMEEWITNDKLRNTVEDKNIFSGTMRLGAYDCHIHKNSLAYEIYNSVCIQERHRHRYEMNPKYIKAIEKNGMQVTGRSTNELVEIVEIKSHYWFLCVQFHPEFQSKPTNPNPIFLSLTKKIKHKLAKRDKAYKMSET